VGLTAEDVQGWSLEKVRGEIDRRMKDTKSLAEKNGGSLVVADTGLWLILGYLLGRGRTLAFSVVVLLLPVAISCAIYVFSPTMLRYGGLSAVDLCLLLFVAGRGWQHDWRDWFWPAVLIIYVGEIVFEATLGQGHGGGMIRFDDPGVQVATSAHIAAAVYAVPMWIFSRTFEKQAK
jgi:hypothetical protein